MIMIRKWMKKLLAPIVREAVKQELAAIRPKKRRQSKMRYKKFVAPKGG